jgi:heterodisulfide reductase subunit A
MVPRANEGLTGLLKLPVGDDGFYNEIHPKLRPVETVVDGVMIAGACQGPKTATECVASGLSAVTQSLAILKKGMAELDPLVATVHESACTGRRECLSGCPYDAIAMAQVDCSEDALDLLGYTDVQMTAMIDGLMEVPVS